MYFGNVLYDEESQESYKGIRISCRETGDVKTFNEGCPVIDRINVVKYLEEKDSGLRWSSDYDHFLMDGDIYVEKYVKIVDSDDPDTWVFVESRDEIIQDLFDFAVISKSEFKTFQELRAYYKNWKTGEKQVI